MAYKLHSPGYYDNGRFLQTLSKDGRPTGYAATSSANNFSTAALDLAMSHINEGIAKPSDYPRIFIKTI